MPFNMYSSYYSHNCNSHGARWHIYVSIAWRGGCSSSKLGLPLPILALKSPHISVTSCCWILSNTFSIWVVACVSSIWRLVSDVLGGT
jgi:hypothetical protein